MTLTRREVFAGAGVIAATGGLGAGLRTKTIPAIDAAALAPPGADVLLLHGGENAAGPLLDALRRRPGAARTAERRIALLDRSGFATIAELLGRARGVQVVALADAAQMLALEIVATRAGVTSRRIVTAAGDTVLIARF